VKLVLVVADAARLDALRRDLAELGAPGYTALPVTEGAGRTGLHSGDRVHPGALMTLFSVVDDEGATALFEGLVRRRDAAADPITRFFLLPIERQA
jgi:nitrogen regulatory protein PII